MKTGKLIYDAGIDRLKVLLSDGTESGGLHCSQCIEVLCPCCGEWRPARVERGSNDWYLAELGELGTKFLRTFMDSGLTVRLEV